MNLASYVQSKSNAYLKYVADKGEKFCIENAEFLQIPLEPEEGSINRTTTTIKLHL